ncbi:MAG: hypothetical protein K9G62_08285 [Alphaproteobacteria bacterium]|nr:hypothetical protein [Alphaproteobacteria bacterium]
MSKLSSLRKISLGLTFCLCAGMAVSYAPILTDEEGAKKTLTDFGLVPLEVGGGPWGVPPGIYKTKFKALHSSGDTLTGYVRRGFVGEPGIRFRSFD